MSNQSSAVLPIQEKQETESELTESVEGRLMKGKQGKVIKEESILSNTIVVGEIKTRPQLVINTAKEKLETKKEPSMTRITPIKTVVSSNEP